MTYIFIFYSIYSFPYIARCLDLHSSTGRVGLVAISVSCCYMVFFYRSMSKACRLAYWEKRGAGAFKNALLSLYKLRVLLQYIVRLCRKGARQKIERVHGR